MLWNNVVVADELTDGVDGCLELVSEQGKARVSSIY